MPNHRLYATLIVVFLTAGHSVARAATEPLTLSAALGETDHAPVVEKSRSAVEEASWKRVEAFSKFLPTVNLGATHLVSEKYLLTDISFGGAPVSVPGIIPTTTYSVGFDWTLFDGLVNVDRFRAGKAMERASRKNYDWTKFQTQRQVVLLFYQSMAAQLLREVAQLNLKTLEDHLNDVELFRKSGISTKFDVLRTDVLTSEARSEVINASDTASVVRMRLSELLGHATDGRPLQGELPVLKPDAVLTLTPKTTDRADIEALREQAAGARLQDTAAGRYWFPKISLSGQYQRYNNLTDEVINNSTAFRDAYSVGLQATWTFDGLIGPTARSNQAAQQVYQAEKTLQMSQLKAGSDVEFWKHRYLYYCEVYRSRLNDIDKSTESVRIAREGRKAGARTNTELLDAELELFRARAERVTAQIGSIEALINLELATGQQLYAF